jgi:flavodoxin
VEALVVYYSRTGFTKELAEEIANRIDGDLEPILENKSREGLWGFFKSGWDSFIEKKPVIGKIDKDFSEYDIVIIGTPVSAGNLSAPVRSFIASHRREFNKVAFFCTFGASGSDNVFKNMEI